MCLARAWQVWDGLPTPLHLNHSLPPLRAPPNRPQHRLVFRCKPRFCRFAVFDSCERLWAAGPIRPTWQSGSLHHGRPNLTGRPARWTGPEFTVQYRNRPCLLIRRGTVVRYCTPASPASYEAAAADFSEGTPTPRVSRSSIQGEGGAASERHINCSVPGYVTCLPQLACGRAPFSLGLPPSSFPAFHSPPLTLTPGHLPAPHSGGWHAPTHTCTLLTYLPYLLRAHTVRPRPRAQYLYQMLPFVEVAHLPSASSFYAAVCQPLGLRFLSSTPSVSGPEAGLVFGSADPVC